MAYHWYGVPHVISTENMFKPKLSVMIQVQRIRRILAFLFFCLALNGAYPVMLQAQTMYAISGSNLISFSAQNPAAVTTMVPVSGIAAGQELSGIDFRPNTGQLYGIGYNPSTGETRLYTIDRSSGSATAVGAGPVVLNANMGELSFDFNPTVDRIRVTGSDNSNYRLHPVTGALAATDGMLAFAPSDANAGTDPTIGAVAYTNSYIGSTATTLYNFDQKLNIVTTQVPPNNGILNTVGASGLSINATAPSADMDIYTDPATGLNQAFLCANTGASLNGDLYRLDLATGSATLIGAIGSGIPVRDIAALIDRTVPAMVSGDLLYALTSGNNLIAIDAANPGLVRSIATLSGLASGQAWAGIDFRPATGELYGLGYNSATGEARLYTINPGSGVATAIGTAAVALKAGMGKVSMDFNPTVDRIRVTGSDNSNFRMHPVTGALAATDGNLAFASGDANAGQNPSVGAVAYTNSFNGSTATTLFNYDDSLNIVTTQVPPNNGTLNTLGASGLSINLNDPSSDLDIYYDAATAQNRAYLAANVNTQINDNLYTLNLSSGVATLLGKIGFGIAITDIAAFIRTQVSISCPANLTVNAAAGMTSAIVNYALPSTTTTCPNGGATLALTTGPSSGSSFAAGATQVCYTATDACGNTSSCCFSVTVNEGACDVKMIGCLRFEILSVRRNSENDEVYRIRVTNTCSGNLSYVAFQLPNGIQALAPAGSFAGQNGATYSVRNPNFSPFYSIRFKADGAGLSNNQSEIFQYTLPKIADVSFIHVYGRMADGSGYEGHLNTFSCPVQAFVSTIQNRNESAETEAGASEVAIYPNPSEGLLFIDLRDQPAEPVGVRLFSTTGQLVLHQDLEGAQLTGLQIPENTTNGLYYLSISLADGTQQTQRLVLQK